MPPKVCLKILVLLCFLFAAALSAAKPQRYIVVFKDHPRQRAQSRRPEFAGARSFRIIPAMAAELDSKRLEALKKSGDVAYIEPDYPVYARGFRAPLSERAETGGVQSSAYSVPYGTVMIQAPQVWSRTKGAGTVVAVLDTGVAMYHPDRGNVVGAASFVPSEDVEDFDSHGTHTAGTIAAAENGIGITGVAPEAGLLIGKVLDNQGSGQTSWVIAGIEWAIEQGADVISMSLGGAGYSLSLQQACDNAYAADILVVAAAGNSNSSLPDYPAGYDSVVSVAAVDQNRQKASFSNFGSTIELAAPGAGILSTVPVDGNAAANAVWSAVSHQANIVEGTAAGSLSGRIINCGLATDTDPANTCPDMLAGQIAHIRRGSISFAEKVARVQAKGAIGVIISNNVSGNFYGTLRSGSPLVVVSISKEDGDALQSLAQAGITGSVSVTDNLYAYFSGTSMAAPHVSGAAALLFAAGYGHISAADVRSILIDSAEDLGTLGWDDLYGHGLIDIARAFEIMEVPSFYDELSLDLRFDDKVTGVYSFGKVYDQSSNGHAVSLVGGEQWGKTWAKDYSVRLNGKAQAIRIPGTALNPAAGTIALRVMPERQTGTQFLIGHIQSANNLCLYTSEGKLTVGLGSSMALASDLCILAAGTVYDLALTWENGAYAVYVNGTRVSTGTYTPLTQFQTFFDIGNMGRTDNGTMNMGFCGVVKEVKVFSDSLAAYQVKQLANSHGLFENQSIELNVSGVTTYRAPELPAGASFDTQTQTLKWRPWYTENGIYPIRLNSEDGSDSESVTLSVEERPLEGWYSDFLKAAGKL